MRNIAIILMALFLASCATFRPDSSGATYKDYNGRVTVENPHYDKRTNVIGYTGMALSAAAGGYAAYKYGGDGIVTYYDNGERKHLKAADAAIGALTGFTISYIVNSLIFKPNDSKYIYAEDEYKKWIRKADLDDKYNFLKSDGGNLSIIDKGYESNFQVHNDTDIEDFQKAFPNSSYLDDVLGKSIKNVSRNQLYALIRKYPNSKNINRMKKHYIESSPTLLEFYKNYYAYPNVGVTNKSGIISILLNKTNRNSLPNIISTYSKDNDVDKLKYAYINDSENVSDLFVAKDKYSDITYDYVLKTKQIIKDISDFIIFNKYCKTDIFDDYLMKKIIKNENNKISLLKFVELQIVKSNLELQKEGKLRYIKLSENYSDLKYAINKFPNIVDVNIPNFINLDESINFYQKVIDSLNIKEAVRNEYKNLFVQQFYSYIKNDRDKVIQFFKKSPYPSFVNDREQIKGLGNMLLEQYGDYIFYTDENKGYFFSRWGDSKDERKVYSDVNISNTLKSIQFKKDIKLDMSERFWGQGDGIGFWESIVKRDNDFYDKAKLVIIGRLSNKGKYTYNLDVIGKGKVDKTRTARVFIFGGRVSSNTSYPSGHYYMTLPPGESRPFIIVINMVSKANNYSAGLIGGFGTKEQIDFNYHNVSWNIYNEEISQATIDEQNALIEQARNNTIFNTASDSGFEGCWQCNNTDLVYSEMKDGKEYWEVKGIHKRVTNLPNKIYRKGDEWYVERDFALDKGGFRTKKEAYLELLKECEEYYCH